MFYLVNFEKENGYAVLSADKRLPDPVLCIVDEGSISVEDFNNNQVFSEDTIRNYIPDFKLYDSETDDYYIGRVENRNRNNSHLFLDYYDRMVDGEHYPVDGCGGSSNPVYTEYGDWTIKEGTNALLNSKWFQSSPFNDKSPRKRKYWLFGPRRNAPAGCVPIAIAQIVTYNRVPYSLTINDVRMDWEKMNNAYDYKGNWQPTYDVKNMLSTLSRNIGAECGSLYSYNWTFTFPKRPVSYLRSLGYKNVKYKRRKNTNACIDMIKAKKPVFIAAIFGLWGGHGWVIDGYRVYQREVTKNKGLKY